MENCNVKSVAIAGDGEYIVRTYCDTHNPGGLDASRVAESVIRESEVTEFLDSGYFQVMLGLVDQHHFDAVLDSLVDAGSESALTFKRRIQN